MIEQNQTTRSGRLTDFSVRTRCWLQVGLLLHKASYLWSPYGTGSTWQLLQRLRHSCIRRALNV